MLHELGIKNYIIFENERIDFTNGLNVITGETGSGKSIIIDAIGVLCGGRFTKEDIKSGTEKAFIEGVFVLEKETENLEAILQEYGIPTESDNTLLIQREVHLQGKSFCRINGQTVTLSMLKNISQYIIDIVAQNEHQLLFKSSSHINLIDDFGSKELLELKKDIEYLFNDIEEANKNLHALYGSSQERERKLDLLKYQIEEINNAKLQTGELEKLKNKKNVLLNAEKLYNVISEVYQALFNNVNGYKSVIDALGQCLSDMDSASQIDSILDEYKNIIANCLYSLEDLKNPLRNYKENIEYNSIDIDVIEERLSLIDKLLRKYGNSIEKIIEFNNNAQDEYEKLKDSEKTINELEEKIKMLEDKYFDKANMLSKIRDSISKDIEIKVEKELNDLNMTGARFIVKNDKKLDSINKNGIDKIEFMLSANPGEAEKPLIKVASGGEISRIMLAIKTVLINVEEFDCVIFDEIDAGIGGITANKVAEKLKCISKTKQTICITHLAQIAAIGDYHLSVRKYIQGETTYAQIKNLNSNERIEELAKMIGGGKDHQMSLSLAKQLISVNKAKN